LTDMIQSSMDDYLKGDILIDNSPLSDAAMVLAGNHTSDFVYQILYTIKYNEATSAIQLLDIYMRNLAKERDAILRSLINQELSNHNYDGARNLPSATETNAARYLINQLINMEQYDLAEEVMDQSLSDSTDDQAFRLMHQFNRNIREQGHCDMVLTSEEENSLLVASNQNSPHAGYARSILSWVYAYEFDREIPLPEENANKQALAYKEVELLPYNKGLVLSPNPAQGEAYVHSWQNAIGGSLELYNLSSQLMMDFDLENSYLNRINVSSIQDGVYIAILKNTQGHKIGSTKLVIVR